jgi:anti-sigma28 factor (negative regulator of flagellin synthesis)
MSDPLPVKTTRGVVSSEKAADSTHARRPRDPASAEQEAAKVGSLRARIRDGSFKPDFLLIAKRLVGG